jgi:branched-chain amino acid transport system ATP-binding protein
VRESLDELRLFGLEDRAGALATSLPYGDQRRLEIVRALALKPKLLLLDEPTAGMNSTESSFVLDLIRRIRGQYQLTIILVEHNMPLVMRLCERIQVLNYGQIIAEGTPEKVRGDPRVIESYLGQVEEDAEARKS